MSKRRAGVLVGTSVLIGSLMGCEIGINATPNETEMPDAPNVPIPSGEDRETNDALPEAPAPITMPAKGVEQASEMIAEAGGEIVTQTAGVAVPEGAVPAGTTITVARVSADMIKAKVPVVLEAAAPPTAFTPHGLTFEKPVTVSLFYEGATDDNLMVMRLDDESDTTWERLPATFKDGVAYFETMHFSIITVSRCDVTNDPMRLCQALVSGETDVDELPPMLLESFEDPPDSVSLDAGTGTTGGNANTGSTGSTGETSSGTTGGNQNTETGGSSGGTSSGTTGGQTETTGGQSGQTTGSDTGSTTGTSVPDGSGTTGGGEPNQTTGGQTNETSGGTPDAGTIDDTGSTGSAGGGSSGTGGDPVEPADAGTGSTCKLPADCELLLEGRTCTPESTDAKCLECLKLAEGCVVPEPGGDVDGGSVDCSRLDACVELEKSGTCETKPDANCSECAVVTAECAPPLTCATGERACGGTCISEEVFCKDDCLTWLPKCADTTTTTLCAEKPTDPQCVFCASIKEQCPAPAPCDGVKCADGSCAPTDADCPSGGGSGDVDCSILSKCDAPETATLCRTSPNDAFCKACADARAQCSSEPPPPPACDGFLCPDGKCMKSKEECAVAQVCNGFKCADGSCVATEKDCPAAPPACDGVVCPDGKCVKLKEECAVAQVCNGFKCADGSCVATEKDCPAAPPACDGVVCPDGKCVASIEQCAAPQVCDGFKCADGSCVGTEADCKTLPPACEGFTCPDGSCAASEQDCTSSTADCSLYDVCASQDMLNNCKLYPEDAECASCRVTLAECAPAGDSGGGGTDCSNLAFCQSADMVASCELHPEYAECKECVTIIDACATSTSEPTPPTATLDCGTLELCLSADMQARCELTPDSPECVDCEKVVTACAI